MQTTVHKMDTTSRYGSNDAASSHSGVVGFAGGSGGGVYRSSNGPHNESTRVLNQNASFGAQFGAAEKYESEGGNSESPYSGWQNLNTSSSNNNWNIPVDGKAVVGRSIHGNRNDNSGKEETMIVDNETSSFSGLIGATGGTDNFSEEKAKSNGSFGVNASRPPHMPRLGLLGGGESSMVTPSSNWNGGQGPPTSGPAWGARQNTSVDMSGNSNAGTPTKPQGSWAQAAGKGLSPPSSVTGSSAQNIAAPETPAQDIVPTTARDRAEQEAQELRMKAAFSQGWGQDGVNQDIPWDVEDQSNQDGGKENANSAVWRAPVNNGTDIWENNLRVNKGSGAPPVPVPTTTAPPWGHTPATNIGGHWGDDESPSTWNSSVMPNANPNPTNWSESGASNSNTMWGASSTGDKHWSGNQASWNDPASAPENASWANRNRQLGNWSPVATPKKEMPPSGWEPPSPPPIRRPVGGNYDDGTSAWGNPQRQGKVSHWKDMPSAKPIMNSGPGMMGPNGMMSNMGMPQSGPGMIRLPAVNKGDGNGTWAKPPMNRGSNWQEMPPHRDSPTMSSWNDPDAQMKNMGQGGQYNVGWNDQTNLCWGAKPKSSSNWGDGQVDTSSWLGPAKQGGKPLCKDIVHASKQFRILTEYGYRKEDVENALRNNNMCLEDAAAELQSLNPGVMDVDNFNGRKVRPANMYEDLSIPDHNVDSFPQNNFHAPNNFQSSINFPGAGHNFKQQAQKGPNSSNVMNSVIGGQPLAGGNLTPALIQKLLQQQQQQQSLQLMNLNNVQPIGNHKFTNNAQLRHLVQQIQMAVQAGHLNAQILNQPLAPPTLQLLYQLLQQIKALSALHQQQQLLLQNSHLTKQPNNNALQVSVQINQAKNRIANLQNQICTQQALFLNQQKQVPPPQQPQPIQSHHTQPPSNDLFKPPMDSMPGLHSDFRDLSLKDMSHHQSRLNQWKLSSMEKDEGPDMSQGNAGDFSRAPGPLNSKQTASSGTAIHSLLEQNDSTWPGLGNRGHGESGWPDTTAASSVAADCTNGSAVTVTSGGQASENKDGAHSGSTAYNLTDLVPEFEPGKPWKGTQMKSVEDDPHITPGSIARSPLSVNSIKDSNIFWPPKSSPANSDVASSTWGYNPQVGPNSSSGSLKSGKSSWSPDFGTESWGSSISKSRNPPPGLSSSSQGWDRQYNSNFLILKNLTPQIDGSTLKTLCMQHGPLQMFHLFLNRGVALVRYSTREEANKAQSALDNCVLSNTTMLADFPTESEIQQYLQVSSGQATGGGNTWPSAAQPSSGNSSAAFYGNSSGASNGASATNWSSGNSTSQLWSFSNSSLWGSSQPSNDHDGSTNPINYLPNDLLGGEPM